MFFTDFQQKIVRHLSTEIWKFIYRGVNGIVHKQKWKQVENLGVLQGRNIKKTKKISLYYQMI